MLGLLHERRRGGGGRGGGCGGGRERALRGGVGLRHESGADGHGAAGAAGKRRPARGFSGRAGGEVAETGDGETTTGRRTG